MWRALVFFAVILCYGAELSSGQTQQYNVTIRTPEPLPPAAARIIGGHPINIERFPFTVQILMNSALQCGGSLLTVRHVLSAAHCFIDQYGTAYSPRRFTIRAGATSLATGGTAVGVSTIAIHEGYNRFTYVNDIAVLVLAARLTLGTGIQVASLPPQGYWIPDNVTVSVVGWGVTNVQTGAISSVLNEAQVYVVNQTVCATRYREILNSLGQPSTITQSMICAGVLDVGGRDACQGDSGGPLIYNNVVVGVTSWGYSCATPRYPGVSARVSSYTNWINATVNRYNAGSRLESVSSLVIVSLLAYIVLSNKY